VSRSPWPRHLRRGGAPWWDCGFESRRRDGCLSLVSVVYVVRQRFLRQHDHSSKGVQPSMLCLSVMSKPQKSRSLAHPDCRAIINWMWINHSIFRTVMHYVMILSISIIYHRHESFQFRTTRRDEFWKKRPRPLGTEHAHCGRPFNFFLRPLCIVFILLMRWEVTI
jgi:hypothetical protein